MTPIHSLKRLLKVLLRTYGWRCTAVRFDEPTNIVELRLKFVAKRKETTEL